MFVDKKHRYEVRVYFEDTDAGGIVYHATYLRFAERARSECLRDLGFPHAELVARHGMFFVVRRAKLDYLRPARLDDLLVVTTEVLTVGGASASPTGASGTGCARGTTRGDPPGKRRGTGQGKPSEEVAPSWGRQGGGRPPPRRHRPEIGCRFRGAWCRGTPIARRHRYVDVTKWSRSVRSYTSMGPLPCGHLVCSDCLTRTLTEVGGSVTMAMLAITVTTFITGRGDRVKGVRRARESVPAVRRP